MTSKKRRSRRRKPASDPAGTEQAPQPQTKQPELPDWHWRTFPVFFTLFAGLLIGSYVGALAQVAGNTSATIVLGGLAIPFAFGLSRVFNRYVLYGRFIRPRRQSRKR